MKILIAYVFCPRGRAVKHNGKGELVISDAIVQQIKSADHTLVSFSMKLSTL